MRSGILGERIPGPLTVGDRMRSEVVRALGNRAWKVQILQGRRARSMRITEEEFFGRPARFIVPS